MEQQDHSGTSPAGLKRALLPLVRGPRILDLGCGRGALAELLRRARPDAAMTLYGMDLSRTAGDLRSLYDVFLRAGPAVVPFPDGFFATVLAVELIEHLLPGERQPVLDEMDRVSGGRVIVTTPAPYYGIQPGFLDRETVDTLARRTPMGLREYVEKALGVHKQVIYPPDLLARGYRLLRGRLGYPRVVAGSLIYIKDGADARRLPEPPPPRPADGAEPDDALYAERLAREIPLDRALLRGRVDDAAWTALREAAETGDFRLAYLNLLGYSASLRGKARGWRANRSVWPSYARATVKTALWRALTRLRGFLQPG